MQLHRKQSDHMVIGKLRGRGTSHNPANRFETRSLEVVGEYLDYLTEYKEITPDGRQVMTKVYRDQSKTILNKIDSEDLPMSWTVNPYRGCEHGCFYCYARPTHEYLGMSSGVDFETKIFAKTEAADLLKKELGKASWKGEPISFSGITDCYQPLESKLKITRKCLEVLCESRQATMIVTKNRLVLRDLELLQRLNEYHAIHIAVSVTSLNHELSAKMEPRASSPKDRLWTIKRLASAGIPVMAMVAPVIPGLTDQELPAILQAVAEAGACGAGYVLLRLPWQNKALFENWLDEHYPSRKDKIISLLKQCHGGKLYDASIGKRMRGEGPIADQIGNMFKMFCSRYSLNKHVPKLNRNAFRRPADSAQLSLFEM